MHAQPPIPLELGQPVTYRAPKALSAQTATVAGPWEPGLNRSRTDWRLPVHIMAGRKTKRRKRIVIPLRWITAAATN